MDIVSELRALIGDKAVLDAADLGTRSAGAFRADNLKAAALARPTTTEEVSAVLRWCNEHGISVVTHGGLTGLVHGGDATPDQVILSLERMRSIETIDVQQRTATMQAGVTLQAFQEAVEEVDLSFPLDLGARGSATMGGVASTNAGGNRVVRYGMMRDMVLGLEAVLADGTIVTSLNQLIKNNTGYDLKQLFIGSEGTLGVITRLVVRLREKPQAAEAAFVAIDSFDQVALFFRHMDRSLGGTLSAFEVMWQDFYRLVTTPPAKGRPVLGQDYNYYALVESLGSNAAIDAPRFSAALEEAFEAGMIVDAAIAQSGSDYAAFWALRDDVEQVLNGGLPVVFDVSLPISAMEHFSEQVRDGLPYAIGVAHLLFIYGHMGDSNLHVNVQLAPADYVAARPKVEALVYGAIKPFGGSVSAEHGIGLEKKAWLPVSRNPTELAVMRTLKTALDPRVTLNPGKIFDL